MKLYVRLLSLLLVMLSLFSCVESQDQRKSNIENNVLISEALFDAWNDENISNTAVVNLVRLADKMIKYQQWQDAQVKLERTLRISSTYSGAWSRLSWLALREAKHNKAVQLALRSNSYTNENALKTLNWNFIRDAYRLLGDVDKMESANKKLQQLMEI